MVELISFRKRVFMTVVPLLLGSTHLCAGVTPQTDSPAYQSYVIVTNRQTLAQTEWKAVVDTLRTKYDGSVILYEDDV
ncbi:MAG: hypothetical protein K9N55_00225, partial [Phycisphaerae bacterium]|nr:hypothetical protein [Phycisphaerae bacterium]